MNLEEIIQKREAMIDRLAAGTEAIGFFARNMCKDLCAQDKDHAIQMAQEIQSEASAMIALVRLQELEMHYE